MKLIPAPGSPQMQKAHSHPYVHTIVAILLDNMSILEDVASILYTYTQRAQPGFIEELDDLRDNYAYINTAATKTTSLNITPEHMEKLIETLRNMYRQSREDITYQRGAIVELLAYELVRPRYKPGECVSNHRFVDGKYTSDQVDVAVLSQTLHQIEGYECKLKVDKYRKFQLYKFILPGRSSGRARVSDLCWYSHIQ